MLSTNNNVSFKGQLTDTPKDKPIITTQGQDIEVLDNLSKKIPDMRLSQNGDSLVYLNDKGQQVTVGTSNNFDAKTPQGEVILYSGPKRLIIDTNDSDYQSQFYNKVEDVILLLETKLLNLLYKQSEKPAPKAQASKDNYDKPDISDFLG